MKIIEHFSNDQAISESEFKELMTLAQTMDIDEPGLRDEIDHVALELSKRRRNALPYPPQVWSGASIEPEKPLEFNVYLENSASMYGYVSGKTEFKEALLHLLATVSNKQQGIRFFFINDIVHPITPINNDINYFIAFMNPQNMKGIGNGANTELNKVAKEVIDRYREDRQPAILVSDYIFSMKLLTDGMIPSVKYTLNLSFQNLDKKKDAILVIKNESMFDGVYYDFKNGREKLQTQRPYYFWVIGPKELIYTFVDDYYIRRCNGFQDFAIIANASAEVAPYHHLLTKTSAQGRYRFCKDQKKESCIEEITFNKRGNTGFQFSLAVDLSKVPVSESFKMDVGNYVIECPRQDSLIVSEVLPISALAKNDERFSGSATHILVVRLEGDQLYKGEQTFKIRLRNTLPGWVEATHTMDDQIMKNDTERLKKTYGLKYLIEGVFESFNPDVENSYFWEIPLIVRNQ